MAIISAIHRIRPAILLSQISEIAKSERITAIYIRRWGRRRGQHLVFGGALHLKSVRVLRALELSCSSMFCVLAVSEELCHFM